MKYFKPQTLNTARSTQLPNSSFRLPTSRMILHFKDCFTMSKIRFQPVDSQPPACALPSAPVSLISTTKLRHKIAYAKNQPFRIRKNLLTNRSFRLKKPKRYVCALQRIFMHFIYILFAQCKRHAAIPYSITVLQLQFTILELLQKFIIYIMYYIYNKKVL